jgi:hypothetical protein
VLTLEHTSHIGSARRSRLDAQGQTSEEQRAIAEEQTSTPSRKDGIVPRWEWSNDDGDMNAAGIRWQAIGEQRGRERLPLDACWRSDPRRARGRARTDSRRRFGLTALDGSLRGRWCHALPAAWTSARTDNDHQDDDAVRKCADCRHHHTPRTGRSQRGHRLPHLAVTLPMMSSLRIAQTIQLSLAPASTRNRRRDPRSCGCFSNRPARCIVRAIAGEGIWMSVRDPACAI